MYGEDHLSIHRIGSNLFQSIPLHSNQIRSNLIHSTSFIEADKYSTPVPQNPAPSRRLLHDQILDTLLRRRRRSCFLGDCTFGSGRCFPCRRRGSADPGLTTFLRDGGCHNRRPRTPTRHTRRIRTITHTPIMLNSVVRIRGRSRSRRRTHIRTTCIFLRFGSSSTFRRDFSSRLFRPRTRVLRRGFGVLDHSG